MDYSQSCTYSTRLIEKLKSIDKNRQLDFQLIKKSIYWAKKHHAEQFRESGEPFYSHPLEVAYMISDHMLKTDVLVASILHDIVEDTEVTTGMILDEFGWRIAEMVDSLTRDRPDGSRLSVEEILNNAFFKSDTEVLLIKCFDRLHNMLTLSAKNRQKQIKASHETFNIFIVLAMHVENKYIEKTLYEICCNFLSITTNYDKLFQFNCEPDLFYLKNTDTHQFVSQVFQNVTRPLEN